MNMSILRTGRAEAKVSEMLREYVNVDMHLTSSMLRNGASETKRVIRCLGTASIPTAEFCNKVCANQAAAVASAG